MEKRCIGIRFLALGLAMVLCPALASCEAEISDSSYSSSSGYVSASEPTAEAESYFVAESPQPLEAAFTIYLGGYVGLDSRWAECYPGYGSFAVQRVLYDREGNAFQSDIVRILEDFPDYEKYPLDYYTVEGWLDYYEPIFTWSFVDVFDFSSVSEESGIIRYHFGYYFDLEDRFDCDIFSLFDILFYCGGRLYYRIEGEEVTFSENALA